MITKQTDKLLKQSAISFAPSSFDLSSDSTAWPDLGCFPLPLAISIFWSSHISIMAEKRKLPTRRESSVKRRASEAPQPPPAKRKASTPAPTRAPPPPERIHRPLPTKIKDAEGLPTVPSPQPASLSTKEYQSIAERLVFNV